MTKRLVSGLALFACVSCVRPAAVAPDNLERIERLERLVKVQGDALAELEGSVAVQSCGEDLATFLRAIRQECDAALGVTSTPVPALASSPLEASKSTAGQKACPAKVVQGAIAQEELLLQARFAAVLYKSLHAVAYLSTQDGTSESTHQRALRNRRREERILRLIRAPQLSMTRFLLVASPERADAAAGLLWLQKFLIEEGKLDPRRLARPLLYDLKLSLDALAVLDRPIEPESRNIASALWIFMLTCPSVP